MRFSWCLWGRVKICGLHITQDLIFIVRKAAEEESQAYFHNGSGPAKAIGPAEHIDSRHFNFSRELYWINNQAHDGEYSSNKKQASNPAYEVESKCVNGKCYDGQSKTDDQKYKANQVCGSSSSSPSVTHEGLAGPFPTLLRSPAALP